MCKIRDEQKMANFYVGFAICKGEVFLSLQLSLNAAARLCELSTGFLYKSRPCTGTAADDIFVSLPHLYHSVKLLPQMLMFN